MDGESKIVITNQYSFQINVYNVGGWSEDGQRVMIISSILRNVVNEIRTCCCRKVNKPDDTPPGEMIQNSFQ